MTITVTPLLETLKGIVGENGLLTGEAVAERSTSFWNPAPMQAKALVRPCTTEELSRVLAACHAAGQPVATQGGMTGCVQSADANADEIVISLERLNAIEEIDELGRTARVQAGVILENLQQAVRDKGLYFPLDLGARGSCTIGGNLATNAGGINVIRYGMAREQTLGLEVVLADGTVISSLNEMMKNNAGYDLKQLFIGSEGTLGIVTRAVVKLQELPVSSNSALLALDSFDKVVAVLKLMDRQLHGGLSAFEVMWGDYYRAVTEPGGHPPPLDRDYPFYVVMEAQGGDPEKDDERFMAVLEAAYEQALILDAVISKSAAEREKVWAVREDFEAILQSGSCFLYDISLPIKYMEAYVKQVDAGLTQALPGCRFYSFGHLGDGNLHFFVVAGSNDQRDYHELHKLADQAIYRPLAERNGSVSAEHGIGVEKKAYLPLCRSEAELQLMRALKSTLDPKGILNPGRIFDCP